MNKKSGFIGIIVVILIAVGIGGFILYKKSNPVTPPVSSQNTNTNTDQKIQTSIKEPTTAHVDIQGNTKISTTDNAYKVVTRDGYTFEAPREWLDSTVTISGCKWSYIIDSTQDKSDGMTNQIDITPKSCWQSNFPYTEKTEKGNFVITVAYGKVPYGNTTKQIDEVKSVYTHLLQTFTIKTATTTTSTTPVKMEPTYYPPELATKQHGTVYLGARDSATIAGLEFKVVSLSSTQITVTITDHITSKIGTATLYPNVSKIVAGHSMTLTGIAQEQSGMINGQTTYESRAEISF